jgi:hypothetical protein
MSVRCEDCGAVASYGQELGHKSDCPSRSFGDARRAWKDPTCPKCGIILGNRMSYCCKHSYCPSGLN